MNKTKKPKTYYAIAGPNAYGVYTDSSKAEKAANYISAYEWEKFKDFQTAKIWATNKLLSLQPSWDPFPAIAPITRLNWCYHRKNI